MEPEILYDNVWNGVHIKVFRTLDGVIFGMRGTLITDLKAGTSYKIPAPNIIATLSGTFATNVGKTGFISTEERTLIIIPGADITGWLAASGVIVFGM